MATHCSVLAWRIPGTGSLVGCRLWGHTELGTAEATYQQQQQQHNSVETEANLENLIEMEIDSGYENAIMVLGMQLMTLWILSSFANLHPFLNLFQHFYHKCVFEFFESVITLHWFFCHFNE